MSHIDQLCLTITYGLPEGPVKLFSTFVPLINHIGKDIAEVMLDFFHCHKIPISDRRGQSHDNASTMPGKYYTGTQIQKESNCELAEFVPWIALSLNLVGMCAAHCCMAAVIMLSTIQRQYVCPVKTRYR